MERRDDDGILTGKSGGNPSSRCGDPAGASPASASTGAPSSRPAAEGETPTAEAGRRQRARQPELRSTEQARGPQHQVKPAASIEEQSGGRAGHATAKAILAARALGRGADSGGVRGAAR